MMSKTYKRNSQFRPKKQGRTFVKDQPWKKNRKQKPTVRPIPDPDLYNEPPLEP